MKGGSKDAPEYADSGGVPRGADDGDGFGEHDLYRTDEIGQNSSLSSSDGKRKSAKEKGRSGDRQEVVGAGGWGGRGRRTGEEDEPGTPRGCANLVKRGSNSDSDGCGSARITKNLAHQLLTLLPTTTKNNKKGKRTQPSVNNPLSS